MEIEGTIFQKAIILLCPFQSVLATFIVHRLPPAIYPDKLLVHYDSLNAGPCPFETGCFAATHRLVARYHLESQN